MALARWQATIVDGAGNVLDGASIEVRKEEAGAPLAPLFSDRNGTAPLGNPFATGVDGFAAFYVAGGAYQVSATKDGFSRTWRYVGIGLQAERDFAVIDFNSGVVGILSLLNGGTGSNNAAGARANLGLGALAILNGVLILVPPQGYLTPVSGTPVISSDVVAATTVFYTPDKGNLIPIYDGTNFTYREFSELALALNASHAANTIYDVFIWDDAGTLRIGTGPAWSNSAAGAGARGTGTNTTQLARVKGVLTNAVAITARNGAATFAVVINRAIYVGSIFIDGTAGQTTCHRVYGQSRKWGIWNAYNRKMLFLKAGDSTPSWSYATATIRPSNNISANNVTVFSGLSEEIYNIDFVQKMDQSSGGNVSSRNGIGWNSTTVFSGKTGYFETEAAQAGGDLVAKFLQAPSLGANVVSALESGGTGASYQGGEDDMLLTAIWHG